MQKLEEKVMRDITTSIENVDCILFDGIAVIQNLQPKTSKQTYRDMTNMFWKYIVSNSKGIQKVTVVFDRYMANSIKSQTRTKCGEVDSKLLCHSQPDMKIPEWKRVMANSKFRI